MSNTNQSKKKNSLGYYAVVTAVATFALLLFHMEVIAKEKTQTVNEKNDSNIESIDVFKIRKNSTDAELIVIKNNLQKKHKVKFEFSDVKRNTSNELTSIAVDIKKGKQNAKSIQNSENQTINEFGVVVITYKNGDKKIGIQTINESKDKSKKTEISNSPKSKIGNQLIVVDGVEMPSSFDYNSIKPDDIESMSVYTGLNATAKYGEKGSNGVIEIETKK
ncbi:TonB-dependent receptor plug domain-containing protein [Flavobacterium chungbukense]|uniref:TonB-dependent receptor plug domain-containing protein n=1 Tax=Flavobacterium chungbukense TaxID=877464 RepID=A0ABP7Y4J3_9FLAO|nr:TonB-dependent receptor plug domain-containing protein [Flavobacterium chungbukense]MCC4923726.1 TonB-dependent receptor plug domain-containing protein [Flavobacterium chungbukense]